MSFRTIQCLIISALIPGLLAFAQNPSPGMQERIWTYDPLAPDAECLPASGCEAWRVFRKAHPSPYQTMALVENGGETVIILSEPPPSLSRSQYRQALAALFGDRLLDVAYFRWPTGLDGYLEDIVLRVRNWGSRGTLGYISGTLAPRQGPAEIIDRLRMLYRLEYGTSDGFWLDTGETAPESAIAEVKAPIRDVYGWIAASGVWRPLASEDQPAVTAAQLNTATAPGAFTNGSGIVVLVAPKKSKLADLRTHFRRFAVSSDLIIGAIGNQNGSMLLLARARILPLSQLPPLRFETFTGFTRNRAVDIAQSYERQRIFAGKIQTGKFAGWDWAPILLSPQLDDTEFGTLLNQADQILKSWSQHGDVLYYAFPYPKPDAYPFGDDAASQYFGKKFNTTSLLFNWNTDRFSEIARVGNQDVLTASRTGALRILYRPSVGLSDSDEPKLTENPKEAAAEADAAQKALDAQNYFANRGNSILVRVVQNVLLYQAVQNFLTIEDAQLPPAQGRSDRVAAVLEDQATKWLVAATQRKPAAGRDQMMQQLLKALLEKSGLTPAQLARLIASPQKINAELERAQQRAEASEREAKALDQQANATAVVGKAAFQSACKEVSGTLTRNLGELDCNYQHVIGSRSTAFDEANALHAQYDREIEGTRAAVAKRDQFLADAVSLREKYVKALALAKIVTELSGYTDLDAVLAEVVRAGGGASASEFIRTPSVVLSKNEQNAEAVGGHNIDLLPSRVLADFKPETGIRIPVAPAARRVNAIAEPAIRRTIVTEPPARVEQVLGTPRSGTLLSEMRARTSADPTLFADVSARAEKCNCDAVISQTGDGTILFVRNSPPPVQQVVYGKSGLIDAMGAPPVLREVHFENFDSASVENLTRTKVLLDAKAEANGFDNTAADLKAAFSGDIVPRNGAEILIARENGEPQFFKLIGDYDPRVSLKEKVAWHAAEVREPAAAEWESTFDAGPPGASGEGSRLIVRFGTGGRDALGISAGEAGNVGLLARLKLVVSQWVARQPATAPAPISAALVDLRASILAKINPDRLQFYIKRNGGVIRGAHMELRLEPGTIVSGE